MVAINISFQFFARIEKIILSTYIPKIISNFIIDIFNDSKIKPVNGIIINNKQTHKYEHLLNKFKFFHFLINFSIKISY